VERLDAEKKDKLERPTDEYISVYIHQAHNLSPDERVVNSSFKHLNGYLKSDNQVWSGHSSVAWNTKRATQNSIYPKYSLSILRWPYVRYVFDELRRDRAFLRERVQQAVSITVGHSNNCFGTIPFQRLSALTVFLEYFGIFRDWVRICYCESMHK
jgi:hypothetical protein